MLHRRVHSWSTFALGDVISITMCFLMYWVTVCGLNETLPRCKHVRTVYLVFNHVFVVKRHEIISVISDDNINVCRWCVILIMVNVGEFYDKITNIQCTLCQKSMYFLYFLSSRHTAGMMALQ